MCHHALLIINYYKPNQYKCIILHLFPQYPYKNYQTPYKNIKFKVSFLYFFTAHIVNSYDFHFHSNSNFNQDLVSHKNLLTMGNCSYNCRLIYLCLLWFVFGLHLLISISRECRKFSCLFVRTLGGCIVTRFMINEMLVIFLFKLPLFSTFFLHSSYSLIFHDLYQYPPFPPPSPPSSY